MKPRPFVPLVAMIVGLVVAGLLAQRLQQQKHAAAPYEAKMPTHFYAGMDKFMSNINWMSYIQWVAAQDRLTPERADAAYRKLDELTNLDPLFADAYLDGALSLAPQKPAEALRLLEKAKVMGLENHWKVPFYAGTIAFNYENNPAKAIEYFRAAGKLPGRPEYVQTSLLSAQCRMHENDPMACMRIWYDYLGTLSGDQGYERNIAISQIKDFGQTVMDMTDQRMSEASEAERQQLSTMKTEAAELIKGLSR